MQKFYGFDSTIGIGRTFGFNGIDVVIEVPLEKPVITSINKDVDMAGVRLEFAQFGDFDSFEVYRSESPMDIAAMPSPIAVGLTTMYYLDSTVIEGTVYYYRVAAIRDGVRQVSDEISELADADLYFSSVDLLLIADTELNSYKDWSVSARTVTKQHQVSVQQLSGKPAFKFEGASIEEYNNINGRIKTSIAPFGTAEYTLEFWGAQTAPTGGGARFFELGTRDANRTMFLAKWEEFDGAVYINNTDMGGAITLEPRDSILRHYAIMRKSGVTGFYINGVLQFSASTVFNITQTSLTLGTAWSFNGALQGYIQQFRVTKLARYNETGFAPDVAFLKK